jgi:hypothetical protein
VGLSALLSTQILDSTATGRSVLTGASASAIRTILGLEIDVAKTWNNALTVFDGIAIDVTDTASDTNSNLLNLKIAGATKLRIDKNARIHGIAGAVTYLAQVDTATWALSSAGVGHTPRASLKPGSFQLPSDGWLSWAGGANGNGTQDTFIHRDAANTVAMRNSTNAQTYRVYGTYTDASNYERGFLQADSNGLTLGHESLGTGVKRSVRVLGQSLAGSETLGAFNVLQTWNTSGQPVGAFQVNVTDTASNAHSVVAAMFVNASPVFRVFKGGVTSPIGLILNGTSANYGAADYNWWSANGLNLGTNAYLSINDDVYVRRDAADTWAQRRATNPQTHRIYNTYTDASNYERARLGWETNQFVIGSEVLGTGTARTVAIVGGSAGTQGVIKAQTGGAFIGAQLNLSNSSNATASTSQVVLYTPAAGQLRITNATSDGFDRLNLGPQTSSFPMMKRNATAINFRLGDDSADAPITASTVSVTDEAYGAGWNGSTQVPTKNAVYDKIEALTIGGGGGYATIEDEGTPLTQRAIINFVGAGVTVTDGGTETVVTIPGGGSGGLSRYAAIALGW